MRRKDNDQATRAYKNDFHDWPDAITLTDDAFIALFGFVH